VAAARASKNFENAKGAEPVCVVTPEAVLTQRARPLAEVQTSSPGRQRKNINDLRRAEIDGQHRAGLASPCGNPGETAPEAMHVGGTSRHESWLGDYPKGRAFYLRRPITH